MKKEKRVDEKSTLWKVPERDAVAESILTVETAEDHLGVDEKRPGDSVTIVNEAGRMYVL